PTAIFMESLGQTRLFFIVLAIWIDAIESLHNSPLQTFGDHRVLIDVASGFIFLEDLLAERRADARHLEALLVDNFAVVTALTGSRTRGQQSGLLIDRAVAIDAIEFDGGAGFTIEVAVAMRIVAEVAIHTVHTFFKVNVFHVNGLLEFLGIVK